MGEIINAGFDRFRPRKLARNKDEEIAVAADIQILGKIEAWAIARRIILEHNAVPLDPMMRKKALTVDAIIHDHPKVM